MTEHDPALVEKAARGLHDYDCGCRLPADEHSPDYPELARAVLDAVADDIARAASVQALREAADEWPIGVCAHRCFRTVEHLAPKNCLLGPDWLQERIDLIEQNGEQA